MKPLTKKMNKLLHGSINGLIEQRWGPLATRDIGAARKLNISMLHESLPPRSSAPTVVHSKTTELVYIIHGRIMALLDGKKFIFKEGDYFLIPAGMTHRFETGVERVQAFSIFLPPLDPLNLDAKMVFEKKKTRSKRISQKKRISVKRNI